MIHSIALLLLLALPFPTRSAPVLVEGPQPSQEEIDYAVVPPGTSRAWALLVSSVLFERNGEQHDILAGGVRSSDLQTNAKTLLERDWDIKSTDHVLQQLEWLEHGGHTAEFEKTFREYGRLNEKELDTKLSRFPDEDTRAVIKARWKHAARAAKLKGGLKGWDLARYVALCRWAFAAGYLTSGEAWKRMDKIVAEVQKSYASWEELGEVYCIGYECWRGKSSEPTVKAFDKLKSDEKSPWKTTPWKLKLVALDKPEKPVKTK
jgi:hypothetical protein